jgi:hypothetical protein
MGETGQLATCLLHSGKSVRPMSVVHMHMVHADSTKHASSLFRPYIHLHISDTSLLYLCLPILLYNTPDGILNSRCMLFGIGLAPDPLVSCGFSLWRLQLSGLYITVDPKLKGQFVVC